MVGTPTDKTKHPYGELYQFSVHAKSDSIYVTTSVWSIFVYRRLLVNTVPVYLVRLRLESVIPHCVLSSFVSIVQREAADVVKLHTLIAVMQKPQSPGNIYHPAPYTVQG